MTLSINSNTVKADGNGYGFRVSHDAVTFTHKGLLSVSLEKTDVITPAGTATFSPVGLLQSNTTATTREAVYVLPEGYALKLRVGETFINGETSLWLFVYKANKQIAYFSAVFSERPISTAYEGVENVCVMLQRIHKAIKRFYATF
jgi:hypothetical protein